MFKNLACAALLSISGVLASSKKLLEDPLPLNITFDTHTWNGYLSVTQSKNLHYMLVESAGDTNNDPLLIWFNGGPGCSSMLGMFQENGPWVIDDDTHSIYKNPHSWNARANVLYLESPAGVGFSYGSDSDLYHNDISQSEDAWVALQQFYELFPEYKSRDLYISGESYGGIYVPYLSW